jgi:hypothetical protein
MGKHGTVNVDDSIVQDISTSEADGEGKMQRRGALS